MRKVVNEKEEELKKADTEFQALNTRFRNLRELFMDLQSSKERVNLDLGFYRKRRNHGRGLIFKSWKKRSRIKRMFGGTRKNVKG